MSHATESVCISRDDDDCAPEDATVILAELILAPPAPATVVAQASVAVQFRAREKKGGRDHCKRAKHVERCQAQIACWLQYRDESGGGASMSQRFAVRVSYWAPVQTIPLVGRAVTTATKQRVQIACAADGDADDAEATAVLERADLLAWTAAPSASDLDDACTPAGGGPTQSLVIHALRATPGHLWPADNKIVAVRLSADTESACARPVSCRIVSVEAQGDPHVGSKDARIVDTMTLKLRAKRSRNASRRYDIDVLCTDTAGHAASASVSVPVARE